MTLAIDAHLRSLREGRRETKIISTNDSGLTAVLLPSSSQRSPSLAGLLGCSMATIRPQADRRRRSPKRLDKDNKPLVQAFPAGVTWLLISQHTCFTALLISASPALSSSSRSTSRRVATVSRTRVRNSSLVQMFPGAVEATLAIFIGRHLSELKRPLTLSGTGAAQSGAPSDQRTPGHIFKRCARLFVPARSLVLCI
jgi:hypothetical protein